jgi:hypothetical protein
VRKLVVGSTAVAGSAGAALKALGSRRRAWSSIPEGRAKPDRWHVVTVNRPLQEVQGPLPEPLASLGDAVEVAVRPAPADKGTELAARPRPGADGDQAELVRRTRVALRDSKQLLETGEVLSPDRPSTTRTTLLNRPLQEATDHGKEEGRL